MGSVHFRRQHHHSKKPEKHFNVIIIHTGGKSDGQIKRRQKGCQKETVKIHQGKEEG
jgi:hypothetical protein